MKKTTLVPASVSWKKFFTNSNSLIAKYLDYFGQKLYPQVIQTIKSAHTNNLPYCTIIRFRNINNIVVRVQKHDYANVLECILQYYSDKQDYNRCIDIKNLISSLKSADKSTKVIQKVKITI